MNEIVVPGRGPANARWMLVGEAPGETEAQRGEPFVGRAGQEQDRYLGLHGLHSRQFYRTNVVKTYLEGNPDPTPELVARWTPELEREIRKVRPSVILAIGRFATRWFLGDVDMEACHGIPHHSDRAPNAKVIPVYHPAAGFYDDEIRTLISYDYAQAADVCNGRVVRVAYDEWEGKEYYHDVSGDELAALLDPAWLPPDSPIGVDTEGSLDNTWQWSIQVSTAPGNGYVLRYTRDDFRTGIDALNRFASSKSRPVLAFHNYMHDGEVCRLLGADLFSANIFDTRYAAYIMRVEPQGLKNLAYRWTGMKMRSYVETVGEVGLEKQIDYLLRVVEETWPKPDPRVINDNDGTSRLYTPQPVERTAERIVADYYSEKVDKDGNRTDPMKRWRKVDSDLRRMVEKRLGRMPVGTLADIPLSDAVHYASRDPDATLRLYYRMLPALKAQGLDQLMVDGCAVLPIFEEMQASGLRANRRYCEEKSAEMWDYMCKLGSRISTRYYGGKPFNPGSADQVAAVMRRRGLQGEKRSKKTGKMSTAKKSIEHLRYVDDAMADTIDWREHQKMKTAFYDPTVERIIDAEGEDAEFGRVRTHINPYKVVSRRISSSDPNLTAIPVRNELGVAVRDGFEAEPGCMLGSWDLSQIEMRYMAHVSRDPLLCRFFHEGKDVHAETAARIFGIKLADVDEMKHRYPAKRAGFGIITNIQGAGLLDQLRMAGCTGWTEDRCDELIHNWLGVYKGVSRFMEDAKDEAHRTGMVRDVWGMPRYLPGVWSTDRKTIAEAERAASSMKIQGGAQGMLQRSMAYLKPQVRMLRESGVYIRWILQIHDEILFEVDENYIDVLNDLVVEALTEHHGIKNISIPIKCSGSWDKTWGKL